MKMYGLIGYPLQHSFSSKFFNEKFKDENIDAEYLNFEIEHIFDLRRILVFNPHLKGLNVTIPYKEAVITFLDDISPVAKEIGAVNVIKIERTFTDTYGYKLKGYNTDYIGFKKSIQPLIVPNLHNRALVLGTGGASKAVCKALESLGIAWTYVSRTPKKGALTYDALTPEILSDNKIIINTTPLGTFPNVDDCPNIPYSALTPQHLLYDLVYNPSVTTFLKRGQQMGSTIKNGAEMLELQALAAWDIWTEGK
ncbi:MAG: shikimate dehydrogenase [Dysgonamonadaceae bacterium]|nr:shikimate dehydrogenase [Dysgonamonadaceae bacterium]MDD4727380.1 shikimate dehydrogenase [Dysgonamonadaceae bacterium]